MSTKSSSVSFSFASVEEKQEFTQYAREKGMTLSSFVKMVVYSYRLKYPSKTALKRELTGKHENLSMGSEAVRPYTSQGILRGGTE